MKRIGIVISIALTLCTGTASARAGGGCWHGGGCWGGGCWPFWGFGLGVGLGFACSYPAYRSYYTYPAYTYAYAPPVYSYNPPTALAPASYSAVVPAPAPQLTAWVPSTPGTGSWVPDPTPYSYTPQPAPAKLAGAVQTSVPTVTVTRPAGGVPVYAVSR